MELLLQRFNEETLASINVGKIETRQAFFGSVNYILHTLYFRSGIVALVYEFDEKPISILITLDVIRKEMIAIGGEPKTYILNPDSQNLSEFIFSKKGNFTSYKIVSFDEFSKL